MLAGKEQRQAAGSFFFIFCCDFCFMHMHFKMLLWKRKYREWEWEGGGGGDWGKGAQITNQVLKLEHCNRPRKRFLAELQINDLVLRQKQITIVFLFLQ